MNERVAIGGGAVPRESGTIAAVCAAWRSRPELRTAAAHDELMRLWVDAEALRLTGVLLRQQLAAGAPGPEGSAAKLSYARLNQEVSGFELELLGADGLRYEDPRGWSSETWQTDRPAVVDFLGRSGGYRYLRAKGNSIEGGTSEILRNIIAERVLGLPGEAARRQGRPVEGPAPMTVPRKFTASGALTPRVARYIAPLGTRTHHSAEVFG